MGTGDDVISLDEIEEAERTGKEIDLRARGERPDSDLPERDRRASGT